MLTNKDYTLAVEQEKWPDDSWVQPGLAFIDHRGQISNLLHTPITSVARIVSARGSVRANHYHKTDWHYAFVESGRVLYFEREIGSAEIAAPSEFVAGKMFFTPPMKEHAMLFAEDSVIYTFARNVRSHENHEADLVRVDFVTSEVVKRFL